MQIHKEDNMMRKNLQKTAVIAALLSLVLAFAMVTISCPDPTGGNPATDPYDGGDPIVVPAALLGKWVNQSGTTSPYSIVVLEFTANQLIISDTNTATYSAKGTNGKIEIGTSSDSLNDTFCESYDITAGVLTFTGGTSEDDYPSANFYKVNALSADQWKDGELTSDSKGQVWYSFNVTGETTYRMWWNDSVFGNGVKTLDIKVSGYYSDGTVISDFNDSDTAWSTAKSFTPSASGTVYVKVIPYSTTGTPTGTFALTYSATATTRPSAPYPSATPLTISQWTDGEITAASNGAVWYSFNVTAGTAYNVWWNESGANGNNTKTLNVSVRGFYSDGDSVSGFSTITTAWATAQSFTSTKSGTVYLKVTPYTSTQTGTFGIVYNTGTPAERPDLAFTPPSTPLTADEWKDGTITSSSGSVAWHSLTVTADTPYYFWWNESGINGNGIKALDISVTAYDSEGSVISGFSSIDTAWTTAKSYTPTADGTLYLRVAPYSSSNTGTYGIVYSETTTRPVVLFNPPNPIALTTDVWANGELTSSIREVWYSFTVTSGTAYRVWWNDPYGGNSTKTGDVKVSGFYSNGTSIFTDVDTAWDTARTITATANDTVYLKVIPYSSGSGTFGIVYSDNSTTRPLIPVVLPSTATPLTAGVWTDGSLTSSVSEAWYSFPVISGTEYRVWWNEGGNDGDGSKTLNVAAGAWYSDGTMIFDGVNAAWTGVTQLPPTITPTANGTVYVRIIPYSSFSSTGTFAITYNADSATMPPVSINPGTPTALTVDTWEDGEITTAGSELWYSFTVTSGTSYRIWLNEAGSSGNGTKTLDITARVFYTGGTSLGTISSAWSSSTLFTPTANGTVYIKITGTNSSGTGTFGVAYTTTTTRPTIIIDLPTTNVTSLTTANTWVNGNIATGEQQWFTFTATTTGSQYIHIALGTLSDMYVQVYDSDGNTVSTEQNIYTSTTNKYISRTVTANQTYYIRIRPYNSTYSGAYKIAFNTSTTAPTS
jgi:hypothetical protein